MKPKTMRFFKSKKGYFFANWCASMGRIGKRYWIQVKIHMLKDTVWTIYSSEKKPRFRNLDVISCLFPFFLTARALLAIATYAVLAPTFCLFLAAAIARFIGFLLLFNPKRGIEGFWDTALGR